MSEPFFGKIEAPGVKAIIDQLTRFITNDSRLRRTQSLNATKIVLFNQGTIATGVVQSLPEAQATGYEFSFFVIYFDELSGRGRFTIHGENPTETGRGFPISSGGTIIEVAGDANIRQFRWVNETGQTLNWSWGLFV